jgi:outer membrane protein
MRRAAWPLATLCLLAFAAPAAALPGFEAGVRGMYWFPDLSGNVQTFEPGLTGTRVDVKGDLGVKDDEFPSGEAFVRVGRVHFRVGYTPIRFDGRNLLNRQITFGGETFTAADTVVSSLDMDMIDGEIQVDLLHPDLVAANFHLGLIVKVKYVDGEVEIRSETSGQREFEDFKAPVPMVGAAAGVGFLKDLLRADARVTGIAYSNNRLVEADGFVSFIPYPFVRIQGGYRYIDLKIDENDVVAEMTLKGPYIGAQLSF